MCNRLSEGFKKISTALVSTYDKTNLKDFVINLHQLGIKIIATGGTRLILEEAGIPVIKLEDIASFPEMLDGRVKTLQPEIFAGILARRNDDHLEQLNKFKINPIDMVICNFYPFEKVSSKKDVDFDELIENIDIGGPTLVRAAAKNHESVTIITNPNHYTAIYEELFRNKGYLSLETRKKLSQQAFGMVASYDIAIYNGLNKFKDDPFFPNKFFVSASKFEDMKYGENPDQRGAVYSIDHNTGMLQWIQLFGDNKSFNNHLDIGHAYEILKGFDNVPTAATVKHGNISGFAFAPTISEAYRLAHLCDPEADYGCTTVVNRKIDSNSAKLIGKNSGANDESVYTEIVVAPEYDKDALEILKAKQKKKMRVIKAINPSNYPWDIRFLEGAMLIQTPVDYSKKIVENDVSFPTKNKPDYTTIAKLLVAWEVVRKVESNGIIIADGKCEKGQLTHFWTLGVGSFRKRNGATKIALDNAGERARGAIAASDGFFPFPDSVDLLNNSGIKAVIQPGGSIRDNLIIEVADKYGIAVALTHARAFRH